MQPKLPEAVKAGCLTHKRHSRFYFADGNIILLVRAIALAIEWYSSFPQVDGVLYNIHRYFLHRDSPVFRDLFSLPDGGCGEGSTDNDPIHLEGTLSIDMERFLSILYPL